MFVVIGSEPRVTRQHPLLTYLACKVALHRRYCFMEISTITHENHNPNPPRNRARYTRKPRDKNTPSYRPAAPENATSSPPVATGAVEGHTPSAPFMPHLHTTPGVKHTNSVSDSGSKDRPPIPSEKKNRRGARFNAGLTENDSIAQPSSSSKRGGKPSSRPKINPRPEELATDLTTTLARALRTPPYPDCPICFSAIHPAQRTWSCSPSIPIIRPPDPSTDELQYCWTTFHVKCIGEWAMKSAKEVAEAWRARGETGRKGDWRCPGCQAKRETVPSGYWCVSSSVSQNTLSIPILGVSVILHQTPSPHASQHPIHAGTHAHVCAIPIVAILVLLLAIQDPVRRAR